MTVTDDHETEVPEAAPLPAGSPSSPDEVGESKHDQEHEQDNTDGPPPLPPLLETGVSTLATTGSGIYAATGAAGLVAAAGVATVAGVVYGMRRHQDKKTTAGAGRSGAGGRGRFFGSPRTGTGRAGRSARSGALTSRGGGRGATSGRHRSSRASSGGLAGATGRAARGTGAGRGSGLFGPSGAGGRSSGAATGLLGSSGASRAGRPTGRSRGGLFGGSSGSAGNRAASRRPGSSGSLLGGAAGRGAHRARGRSTAIIDPATPVSSGRGRMRRAVRTGWDHPRTRKVRTATRRGATTMRRSAGRARLRVRSHTKRLGDYLKRRKWALRMRGWGRSFSDWWRGLWDTLRGRASDPRYGRMKGWQLTAAAAAIGALGAGKRKARPRPPLVGRVIGTAAPTPGNSGPITMAGRTLLALTTGEGEEPLATEAQRVKDAADELRAALAGLGGSQVGMLTYEQGLRQLGPILGAVADGFKDMATTAEDEQPLDPAVLEFFGTIEGAARGASEVAGEMPGLFRAAHEVELERLEAPRRNEHKWDVSQQN